jgi:hypothetical protein
MPFLLKDETAGVDILYIDNTGKAGLLGSANAGQALSFQGLGLVNTDTTLAPGIAGPGTPSPLTGTVVIPINSTASVSYSVPQVPTVSSDSTPDSVTTTSATFTNTSTTAAQSVGYKVW